MEQILARYNPWWEKGYEFPIFHQRPYFQQILENNLENRSIIVLTGLRRIGKTTLMKLFIENLIKEKKIDPKHIFFISLDEYLLRDTTLSELLDNHRKIHKLKFEEKVFVFFDEITAIKDVEIQLKNLYDNQNLKIIISSSSASLIKSKKPYLTGRSITIEILPLTFEEYLDFKGIKISQRDLHLIEGYFEDFLKEGGMPEYILRNDTAYLKEVVDDIIYKDIVSVHRVSDVQILKDMFLLLMERSGKTLSIRKIANVLKISNDTAKRYLEMFESTYLIHTITRVGKTNERILSPKKLYAPDLGIKCYFSGYRDKGSLFENYIYLLIKNKEPRYVYEDGIEIDFLTNKKDLIECKYGSEMTSKQKKLFESFPAKKRILIDSLKSLKKYIYQF